MKVRIIIFWLTIISFIPLFGQQPEEAEILTKLENQLLEAAVARNNDFLTALFDDQFHGVLASGMGVNKSAMIEFLNTGSPHVFLSLEGLKASHYGTVGVTTGKLMSRSKSGSIIGQSRFTHIFLKKNNQWKMIGSQNTVIIQN
ncbi:MAG: nuclear transport factor 2 family protein [Cytophagales bacterium]|nr:nuclear transport factor 2 family protein [Cytophagales bacterium]